jgi:hypothetical protein
VPDGNCPHRGKCYSQNPPCTNMIITASIRLGNDVSSGVSISSSLRHIATLFPRMAATICGRGALAKEFCLPIQRLDPDKTISSHQHLPTHRDRSDSPTRILVVETLWTRHVTCSRWAVQSQVDMLDPKHGWQRAAQFWVSAAGHSVIGQHWCSWR